MKGFGVLTNRKRALIALIHSAVFLGVALHGFLSPKAGVLHSAVMSDFVMVGIYLIVASILAWLVSVSRGLRERAYFSLCTSSATFGLLRTVFGDASMPAAQYMRVVLLSSAVALSFWIVRSSSRTVPERVLSE